MQNNFKNSNLLIDIQYFGSINYNKMLFEFSNIIFEQYETYQKMSFRNRCRVAGSNGVVNLSVPLVKGRGQRELMKDVKISYTEQWQLQHWRTIESCYRRAPFFEYYADGIKELLQLRETFLLDLNLRILEWLQGVIKRRLSVSLSTDYLKNMPEGIVDRRGFFLPKNQEKESTGLKYTQVFEDRIGFCDNLSIIDLLCCCGPETLSYLQNNVLPI